MSESLYSMEHSEKCYFMLILLKIIYFILEILTRYLLMPFAWLSVKIYEFRENTKNKIIYYLMKLPNK